MTETGPDESEDAAAPVIVTLVVADGAQAHFQAVRDRYFPPALNRVPAHLTLFHHLPGERADEVDDLLRSLCAAREPFAVNVTEVRSLGRGVAYRCESHALMDLRGTIAETFSSDLTRQDAQGWRPHVTVQNKVSGEVAKRTHEELSRDFEPWSFRAEGLRAWDYLDGPWRERLVAPFRP